MLPVNNIDSHVGERPDLLLVDIPGDPLTNISPDFSPNGKDSKLAGKILALVNTNPKAAMKKFIQKRNVLSDYSYWYLLGFLWCSNANVTDLKTWRMLFNASRNGRATSLMKPNEYESWRALPATIEIYRAEREPDGDRIAFSLSYGRAFALMKAMNRTVIAKYQVERSNVAALFLRRGELEVIVLDDEGLTVLNKVYVDEAA